MADLDERLNQLISDQENMNKVLEMAKAILAQRDSASPEPAKEVPPVPPQQPAPSSPDLASLLASMMTDSSKTAQAPEQASEVPSQAAPAQGLNALAAILPQLLQAMSGEGNLIKSERVNLLKAMRPYLKEQRWSSIDRALKMANVTKAATSAMHLLGR